MQKNELINEIRKHHVYLTGSKNEAAGYHAIEGISLGLPILYYDSGGIPEYSSGFGMKYIESNFEEQLVKIRQDYFDFLPVVEKCNFSGQLMSKKYLSLFENLLNNQELSSDQYDRGNIFYLKRYLLIYRDKSLIIYKQLYSLYSRFL
jgi:hypothetical protein